MDKILDLKDLIHSKDTIQSIHSIIKGEFNHLMTFKVLMSLETRLTNRKFLKDHSYQGVKIHLIKSHQDLEEALEEEDSAVALVEALDKASFE